MIKYSECSQRGIHLQANILIDQMEANYKAKIAKGFYNPPYQEKGSYTEEEVEAALAALGSPIAEDKRGWWLRLLKFNNWNERAYAAIANIKQHRRDSTPEQLFFTPKSPHPMTTGIDLIAQERAKQIGKYGYTPEHDAKNFKPLALAEAAMALLQGDQFKLMEIFVEEAVTHLLNHTLKERIAIAGAWLAAELDRWGLIPDSEEKS